MNILLVDDNIYVLKGLKQGIDYAALGIDGIFAAKNMSDAVEIMEREDIPLVLTDIEMPGGTGLQFLEWINEHFPRTVTLFCTCFADFDYARKAVELHCFDYYLKPIQYDKLQEILVKAVAEVHRRKAAREKEICGEYWMNSLDERRMFFWENVFLGIDSCDAKELDFLARNNQLPYTREDTFTLGLLRFEKHKSGLERASRELERFVLNNMIKELLESENIHIEALLKCRKDTWALVLSAGGSAVRMHNIFTLIVTEIHKALHAPVNGYYTCGCTFDNMRSRYMDLEFIYSDHVFDGIRIVDIDAYQPEKNTCESITSAELKAWETFLRTGQSAELKTALRKFVNGKKRKNQITRQFLRSVRLSVMQMVYSVLWEHQIDAGLLFEGRGYDALHTNSLLSADNLIAYLDYVFDRACAYINESKNEGNTVARVKKYVDQHYCEEITREDLGKVAYLSAGYLGNYFKKEMGISLGSYIMEKRLEKACALLQEGKLSVSEVAKAVGYDNFSYFSRLFKAKVGKTPKDYCRQFKK